MSSCKDQNQDYAGYVPDFPASLAANCFCAVEAEVVGWDTVNVPEGGSCYALGQPRTPSNMDPDQCSRRLLTDMWHQI